MFAVILIGGMGTRLRPLTCDTPKPLLPVLNRPFLHYQFEVLKKHGIKDVILCTSYQSEMFRRAFGNGRALGLRLRFIKENNPLGTGGALKNAQDFLPRAATALVLNGDVLNALDITAFLKFHRRNRADASIALTRVKDPTLYGVVQTDETGHIRRFLEKPSWDEIESNTINAGAYLIEPPILDIIPPGVPYSLERSLFPFLLQSRRRFFGYVSKGYWIDIGTTEKYLQVHMDILEGLTAFKPKAAKRHHGFLLAAGARLGQNLEGGREGSLVAVGAGTVVGNFVRFGGHVCLGARCRVGKGALLEDSVILDGAIIGEGATLRRCVVGPRCQIGAHSQISEGTVLAADSKVLAFSRL